VKILASTQQLPISDAVRSKFAMVAPVDDATLRSLKMDRVDRLGGYSKITLYDLARELREGAGDAGICFEYAVHDGIANKHPLIYPVASEALEKFCGINAGAQSLLFGPEKDGRIPVVQSVDATLTDESRLYVGGRGQPPKLKKHLRKIVAAFRRQEARERLPASIRGLWKADLFLGNQWSEAWVGTTVKINPSQLAGAAGLRIGIYPRVNNSDVPRKDDDLNLIRLPLPYDGAFMELYYKSFFLVKAFLEADAKVPAPVSLPDAEDRFVAGELETRREFPVLDVVDVLRKMGQQDLVRNEAIRDLPVQLSLSEAGLVVGEQPASEMVSLTPVAIEK
jgi:hypothetical protein